MSGVELDGTGLVEKLRAFAAGCRGSMWQSRDETIRLCDEAADRIEALSHRAGPMEAVAWRDELRSIIFSATHAVLPLADDVTGIGIRERAAMQVEIADRILQALALIPQAEET